MNVDGILRGLNDHGVEYILIGGMNFLLRHRPVLTYDVDILLCRPDRGGHAVQGAVGRGHVALPDGAAGA